MPIYTPKTGIYSKKTKRVGSYTFDEIGDQTFDDTLGTERIGDQTFDDNVDIVRPKTSPYSKKDIYSNKTTPYAEKS